MDKKLTKQNNFAGIEGPVLTIVMDGIGAAPSNAANAVAAAYTPTLDMLAAKYPECIKVKVCSGIPFDDKACIEKALRET